jgi:hypothetical protein
MLFKELPAAKSKDNCMSQHIRFHRNLSVAHRDKRRAKTGKKQPPCSCGRTTICAGYRGEVDTIRDTLQLISCSRGFGFIVEACLHQQVRRQRRA